MDIMFQKIKENCQTGHAVALVLVVESSDGTPRKAGAKMLVGENGPLCGTVGGGNIEYRAIETAKKLIPAGTFLQEEYVLRLDDEKKLGMTCGGDTKLVFHVLHGEEGIAFAEKGLRMCEEKRPYCLAIPMTERKVEVWEMQEYHTRREQLEHSDIPYYTEFFLNEGKVYLFGGGHVAYELLPVLAHLDFRCVLLDDREEFANGERFPDAEEIRLVDYKNLNLPVEKEDFVVIMTRGHLFDAECERFVLGTNAAYIGVMGSRKKAAYIYNTLKAEGFSEENLSRIVTPIGLSIGSETPQEIAISIAAQLIQARAEQRAKRGNVE